jgi:hypothetical protein
MVVMEVMKVIPNFILLLPKLEEKRQRKD